MRQTEVLSLMRENVAYKLEHGRAKEAVDMLEKLHKYVKYRLFKERGRRGDLMVSALYSGSSGQVRALARVTVLCSWARYFTQHSASLHPEV